MAENRKVLLRIGDVKMHFPIKNSDIFSRAKRFVRAVDGVSINIYEGETLGLVGESGCGKSTLGRLILQLYSQTAGSVRYEAVTVNERVPKYLFKIIRKIAGVTVSTPELLLANERDCLSVAGGLLCHSSKKTVSELLNAKYEALKLQNAVEDKINLLELKCESENEGSPKYERYQSQLKVLIAELDALKSDTAKKSVAVEKLRESCKTLPGFEALESALDYGVDLSRLTREEMRVLLCDLQMVFQDPYSSLNPRLTVGQLIAEALVAHNMYKRGTKQMENYTLGIMEKCGLQAYMLHRYPHQFSGGQRQRIGIARSLALKPKFVVCDEAVSALDVSIQSQIINLLMDLKEQENLTYLFISHDLSAVKFISDRIGVMYLGNIIELGNSNTIFESPLHPYTQALIDAIPTTEDESNRELQVIEGDIPSPINPPPGCKFHTRCKYAADKCKKEAPEWREWRREHYVACHFPLGDPEN